MAAKKGLGKGLDSLISTKVNSKQLNTGIEEKVDNKDVLKVKISSVEPNRNQPRKKFDEDALIELSESIKQYGIIQPIIVQDKGKYYEIIAGERRWRAANMAGLKEVPVIIKKYTDREIMEISLIENIQRENLNPIEEALAYSQLINEFNLKQDELAERVSKSRTAVTNSMRLLKLSDKVQQMIVDEMISTGHARCLITIEDKEKQHEIALKVFDEKLSVRETEKLVKNLGEEEKRSQKTKIKNPDMVQLEERMRQIFGTKVMIQQKSKKKGKIEIEYYSDEELERIIDSLLSLSGE